MVSFTFYLFQFPHSFLVLITTYCIVSGLFSFLYKSTKNYFWVMRNKTTFRGHIVFYKIHMNHTTKLGCCKIMSCGVLNSCTRSLGSGWNTGSKSVDDCTELFMGQAWTQGTSLLLKAPLAWMQSHGLGNIVFLDAKEEKEKVSHNESNFTSMWRSDYFYPRFMNEERRY